jgi:hypothetical protein
MQKRSLGQSLALAASALLFGLSLFQPVWKCANGGVPFDGLTVLAIGFMGLLAMTPTWFCNGLLVLAVVSFIENRRVGGAWIPYTVARIAATALFWPRLCGAAGGSLGEGTGLDKGAVLWVISICFAALSMHYAPNKVVEEVDNFQPTRPMNPQKSSSRE